MANVRVVEGQNERVRSSRILAHMILPRRCPNCGMQVGCDARPRGHQSWGPRIASTVCNHLSLQVLGQCDGRIPKVCHNEGWPMLTWHRNLARARRVSEREGASHILLHDFRLVEGLALIGTVDSQQILVAFLGRHRVARGVSSDPTQLLAALYDLGVPARALRKALGGSADEVATFTAIAQRSANLPSCATRVRCANFAALLNSTVCRALHEVRRDVRVLEAAVQRRRVARPALRRLAANRAQASRQTADTAERRGER
mmetsp:Transcript_73364/g.203645  ORF Transcript_73364/g.203645 Transcript_73364/m.203645 type:complete len:259 (+) Transcript_73364:827-1603(+)